MSRSRKKTPIVKSGIPGGKKAANRKVRRSRFLLSLKGNQYKKLYSQYDVIDYTVYASREDAVKDGEMPWWEKYFHRK